jgi:hypothetical protein
VERTSPAVRAGRGLRARRGGVVVTPTGCMTVGVAVAGATQPELWDDARLIRAAKLLLHLTSVR